MKGEEPTPNGAGSSEESNGYRRPEATATAIAHQVRKRVPLASTRSDCIRIITRLVGNGGLQSFLKCQQPALGDRTGAQLLQNEPSELLDRLRRLEAGVESDHDEALVGPACDHIQQAAPWRKFHGVLGILDQLASEQSNWRFET